VKDKIIKLLKITTVGVVLFACQANEESPTRSQLPEQTIRHFSFIQTEGLAKLSEIEAERAEIFKDEISLKSIKVKFYAEKKVISILEATEGKVLAGMDKMITADLIVSGEVVLIAPGKGIKLELNELRWNAKEKKFISDGFVKETTEEAIIVGKGLEATADLSKIVIKEIKGHTRLEGTVCDAE